ncbi:MAG: amidohydrolase family protein [Syntrophobacteraceae bacterium]|nr:amidohydrolase family protein [Desulfobacteraceae bacterium]
MRIDVHTHIFPPEIVADRGRFFSGEPEFKLLYGAPRARLATAETLLEAADRDEVDRVVAFGFPWRNGETAARHNDYVLEAAFRHGTRIIALACVNPVERYATGEAERCLDAGAAGLGELAVYGRCDPAEALKAFAPLVESCRGRGGVLLVHANEPVGHLYPGKAPMGLGFFYSLAALAAGMPLILAHWGGGLCFFELLRKEAPEILARVYYDTAASPYLYRPDIYPQMVRTLPGGKILFGSDYPLLPPSRYFREMEASGLSRAELDAVCGANAAALFADPSRPRSV